MFLLSSTLVSCSDDDEGNGGANISMNMEVGTTKAKITHVFWNIYPEQSNSNGKFYQIEFYSFNPFTVTVKNFPNTFSTFECGFYANGSDNELPTGSFDIEDFSGALNTTQYEDQYGTYIEIDKNKSGKLVISKEGNTYSVSITPLVINYNTEDEKSYKTTTIPFSIKCVIPKAPYTLWEQ